MKTTFIYGLFCPLSGELRYIGKSNDPQKRLTQHCRSFKSEAGTHKAKWIKSLLDSGMRPTMRMLSEVPIEDWEAEERYLIASYGALGARLTNATEGGDGVTMTPEIREKIRAAVSNPSPETLEKYRKAQNNRSPETLAKMANSAKNRVWTDEQLDRVRNLAKSRTPEHIQKMANALKGKKLTQESIAKRTASVIGSKRSDETRAKMAKAQIGKKHSDETRAKLSAAHAGRTLPPEQRAKMAEAQRVRWAKVKASGSQSSR